MPSEQGTFEDLRKAKSEEILLNPSVPNEEEMRLSRQAHKMYRLFLGRLQTGCLVSTIDMFECGSQYSARLFEIRQRLIELGWCIDMVTHTPSGRKVLKTAGINYYSIVPLADSEYYKKWQEKHRQ